MNLRLVLMLVAALTLTGGCGLFKGRSSKDNIEPPAELVKFEPSHSVTRVFKTGVGKGERKLGIRQPPAVANGRVYTGSVNGRLTAFDAATGKTLWEDKSDLRWSGGPGIGEGTLVAGTLDGLVVAFNPDSGTERWRAKASSEVISTPAIARGLAVVRSNDGRVFGFSITSGERRWVYDRGLPSLTLRGNGRPVIDGNTVYVGYDGGDIVALKIEDGTLLWEQSVGEGEGRTELERMVDVDGDIVVSGSEVYVAAYNSRVLALDTGSGRPLWTRDMSVYGGVALAGDNVLVSDAAGTVWALDRRSGASVWRQDGLAHRWLTTPGVVGNHVVVGDLQGYLHWLSLDSGTLAARERLARDPLRATPQVMDGVVYALSIDGELAAYRSAP